MTNRRTKGAGSVFRDAKGTWHFRKDLGPDPVTGKRRVIEARGKVKSEVRARFEAKLAEAERTGITHPDASPTLRDWCNTWLADYVTRVKPTTYRTRAGRLNAICDIIGHVRLVKLTPEHVRTCMRALGERLAPTTLKDHYVSLKMVLDQAELDGLIPLDPCRKVKPPRVEQDPVRILDPDQPRQLIATVPDLPRATHGPADSQDDLELWALLFELAFTTGLRPGERRGLTPDELETRGGTCGIFVRHQLQDLGTPGRVEIPKWLDATHVWGTQWLTTPKTRAGQRFIPLPEDLWGRLWARIGRMHIEPHDLVFRTHLGRPVSGSNERRHFRKALAAAGLPDVKLYSARHWTATMTALADMPDDARIAIMGHTDPAVTMRYTHRGAASLARLMADAIPDLGGDTVEAEIIDD